MSGKKTQQQSVPAQVPVPATQEAPEVRRPAPPPPPPVRKPGIPVEYCVVNGGKVVSCFETMAEAKAERFRTGATSVVTRKK